MLLAVLLACEPEPMISAVQPPAERVEEVRTAREQAEIAASPAALDLGYVKPEGVYVDVAWLGGRTYSVVRGEVAAQLGALVEEGSLPPGQGQEFRFEKGTLRVSGDRILLVDVPLPEPMRRSEALRLVGFPDQVPRNWVLLSGEFRLTSVFNYRRIILDRVGPGEEDVIRVRAWKEGLSDR